MRVIAAAVDLEARDHRARERALRQHAAHGQAGALSLGVARALKSANPALFERLRQGGFLTRDPRMKERKKYGKRGARRGFQFSKR